MRILVIFVSLITASVSLAGQQNCRSGNCSTSAPFRFGQSSGGCASGNCGTQQASYGQQSSCPNGQCSLQRTPALTGWFENPVNGGLQLAHYKDGKCVGAFIVEVGCYMPYNENTKSWGDAVYELPKDLPSKYKLSFDTKKKAEAEKKRLEFESKEAKKTEAGLAREKIEATLKEVEVPKKAEAAKDGSTANKPVVADAGSKIPKWMKDGVDITKPAGGTNFTENSYIIDGQIIPEGSFMGPDEQGICPNTQDRKYLTAFAKDPAMRDKIKKDFLKFKGNDKVWAQVLSPESWQAETHKLSESKKFDKEGVCYFYQGPKDKENFSKPIWAEFGYMPPEDIGRKIDKDFRPDDVPSSSSHGGNGSGMPLVPLACGGIILFAVFSKKSEE